MKKILFGLLLYCFTFIEAQAVWYYAWKHSATETSPVFFNELDQASTKRGQEAHFRPVVLIVGDNEHGSGILIEPPAGRPDLRGRLVLTAAHVISENEGKRIRIHPTGLLEKVDEAGEDELRAAGPLIEIRVDQCISHPTFNEKEGSTRQFDYGLIILDAPLELPTVALFDQDSTDLSSPPFSIDIAGFGNLLMADGVGGLQTADGGFRKRAFESLVSKKERNIFELDLEEFLPSIDEKDVFTFPYTGDSGGAVFVKGHYGRILGVVSGREESDLTLKYIHVTNQDVVKLLSGAK